MVGSKQENIENYPLQNAEKWDFSIRWPAFLSCSSEALKYLKGCLHFSFVVLDTQTIEDGKITWK